MSGSRHPNNLKSAGSLQEFLLVHHALGITRHVVVQPFCVLGRNPYTAVRDPFSESGIKDFLSVVALVRNAVDPNRSVDPGSPVDL